MRIMLVFVKDLGLAHSMDPVNVAVDYIDNDPSKSIAFMMYYPTYATGLSILS